MVSIESPESSSPIVTRSVAAGLRGAYCDNYMIKGWQRALLNGLGVLPQGIGRFVISRFEIHFRYFTLITGQFFIRINPFRAIK